MRESEMVPHTEAETGEPAGHSQDASSSPRIDAGELVRACLLNPSTAQSR